MFFNPLQHWIKFLKFLPAWLCMDVFIFLQDYVLAPCMFCAASPFVGSVPTFPRLRVKVLWHTKE